MRVMNVDVDKTVIRTVIRNQIHIKDTLLKQNKKEEKEMPIITQQPSVSIKKDTLMKNKESYTN